MLRPQDAWDESQFVFVNKMNDGRLASSFASNALGATRDKAIEAILVTAGLATGPAGWVATGAGIVIDSLADEINRMARLRESQRYIAETGLYCGLVDLQAKVCYTNANGVIVVHGIDVQNFDAQLRINGYIEMKDYGGNISAEQLQLIMQNGNISLGRTPLPEDVVGFTAEQQKTIYDDYKDFEVGKRLRDYRRSLGLPVDWSEVSG